MHRTKPAINWSRLPVSQTLHQPQVYGVRFLQTTKQCPCPFPGCPGYSRTWNGLRYHFNRQHWGGRIRILEDHPKPLPRCERCRIQVPAGRLIKRHYMSYKCKQREERRLRRETPQHCFGESKVSFQTSAETLPSSEAFPYLGRTIVFNNIDWSAFYLNLR